jgi:hypothetical protein
MLNSLETPERKLAARKRKQDIYINVVIPRIVRWISTLFNSSGKLGLASQLFALFRLIQHFSRNDSIVFGQIKAKKPSQTLKPPKSSSHQAFSPFQPWSGEE